MEKKRIHKDIIIIGAGMAGLTAALYAGRMALEAIAASVKKDLTPSGWNCYTVSDK